MTTNKQVWLRCLHDVDMDRTEYHRFRTDAQAFDWLLLHLKVPSDKYEELVEMLEQGEYIESGEFRWDMCPPDLTDHTEE